MTYKELLENSINLGLSNKVKARHSSVEAIDNISIIHFEDPEVARICHEHGVYTKDDAASVTSIKPEDDYGWFQEAQNIKRFNEFQYFTSLKEIEDSAFMFCDGLETIILPANIKKIGYESFTLCKNLKNIVIPLGVETIEGNAFFECESLKKMIIPNGVKEIGHRVFENCQSLRFVSLPASLISIGYDVFSNCSSLKTVYIDKYNPCFNDLKDDIKDDSPWIRIVSMTPKHTNESSHLGLNDKVSSKYKKKDSIYNLYEIITDKKSLVEVFGAHGIKLEPRFYFYDEGLVVSNGSICRQGVKITLKNDWLWIQDTVSQKFIVHEARENQEFLKECHQKNRIEWVKFECSKEHPLAPIVLEKILYLMEHYDEIWEKYKD